jgi:septum formation protein
MRKKETTTLRMAFGSFVLLLLLRPLPSLATTTKSALFTFARRLSLLSSASRTATPHRTSSIGRLAAPTRHRLFLRHQKQHHAPTTNKMASATGASSSSHDASSTTTNKNGTTVNDSNRFAGVLSNEEEKNPDAGVDDDPMRGLPQPLILGSESFTRKLILKEGMGIDFVNLVRPIDEKQVGGHHRTERSPHDLVHTIAHAKMDHLLSEILAGNCEDELRPVRSTDSSSCSNGTAGYVVLTADQVVTCNGRILEKPDSIAQAKEFVSRYGEGHPCSTVGCIVIAHVPSWMRVSDHHVATVHFTRALQGDASAVVDALLQQGAPILSCAGGLMIEHELTQQYVDRIEGTQDSIMGLSKDTVRALLNELRTKLAAGS